MVKRIVIMIALVLLFILFVSLVRGASNTSKSNGIELYKNVKIMDDKEEILTKEQINYIKMYSQKTNNTVEKLFLEGFIYELTHDEAVINEKYDEALKHNWQNVNVFITLHLTEYEIAQLKNEPWNEKEIIRKSSEAIHSLTKGDLQYYQKQVWDLLEKVLTVDSGIKEVVKNLNWILKQFDTHTDATEHLPYSMGLAYMYDYLGEYKISTPMYFNILERVHNLKNHPYMIMNVVFKLAERVASVGEVDLAVKMINDVRQIPIDDRKGAIHGRNVGYYTLLYIGLEYDKKKLLREYVGYLRMDDPLLTPKEQEYFAHFKEYVLLVINAEDHSLYKMEKKFEEHLQKHPYHSFYNDEKYVYNVLKGDRYFNEKDYNKAEYYYKEAMKVNYNRSLGELRAFNRIVDVNITVGKYKEVNQLMSRYYERLEEINAELNDTYGQFIVNQLNDKLNYYYAVKEKSKIQQHLRAFLLVTVVVLMSSGIVIKRSYKRNHYDQLTSVYTYKRYAKKVKILLKHSKEPYVLFNLDILNFKLINLIEGFKEGDKLLILLASCINEMKGKDALVCRIGNDVFSVCMEKRKYKAFLEKLINKIKYISNHEFVQLSVGVYEIENPDENVSYMIECANTARIFSKKNQNQLTIFKEHMVFERKHQNDIKEEMKNAIEKEEFYLQFQPKFMSHTKELIGFEGLIRWENEKLGFISPDQFIGIAEGTGYINEIGRWVFEEVCRTQREWIDKGYEAMPISFNVSRIELFQEDLVQFYKKLLQYYHIPVHLLEIEITESVALENKELFIRQIQKLKSGGFKIAIDDFGTGNSNLSNLKDMNVDTIKIDRSLMNDIETEKKAQDIILLIKDLCHLWNIEVVCEGVESVNQVALLNQRATWIIQGYVFSKPLVKEEAEKLLTRKIKGM